MTVTLKDVAAQSGVSLQTASQILRGRLDAYRPATCERVRRTARRLRYEPNVAARSLAGGATMTIGLIARALGGRTEVARLRSAVLAAQAQGYMTYLVNLEQSGDNSEQLLTAARQLIGRRVDGILIYHSTPIKDHVLKLLTSSEIPVVFVDWAPDNWPAQVAYDMQTGVDQVAEHLAELGHRYVAKFITPMAKDYPAYRLLRYERAFDRLGMSMLMDPRWTIRTNQDTEVAAYEAVLRFLQDGAEATALVMNNDYGAFGALAALQDVGLRVPEDVSVVGFDNVTTGRFCSPTLTTVKAPGSEVGPTAFGMLHRLIDSPAEPVKPETLSTQLVVRESTGPVPSAPPRLSRPSINAVAPVRRRE